MPTLVQRPSTGFTTATAPRRRKTPWWQILAALFAAFVLLVAFSLLWAWVAPHWPRPPLRKGSAPIQLTIQPSGPEPTPGLHKTGVVPPEQKDPDYIRTNDQAAETPPPSSDFTSDKDTNAHSEKPADDPFKPLPTQDGRESTAYDFETRPWVPGKEAHDVNSDAAPSVAQSVPTPQPEARESPTPTAATPSPSPGDFRVLKADASPSNTPPRPSPTPPPKESSTPPIEDALAKQAARVRQENASVSSRSIPQTPGYQPQTTQTKMSGSTKDLGKASVNALGTPLGKYEKAVSDAVGSRWYQLVNDQMSNLIRTEQVQIHFVVTRSGKIVNIEANGSKKDTILAQISMQAIHETDLPPIPEEVASKLPEGQLDVDFTFGLFEQ